MTDPAEAAPSLFVERALTHATEDCSRPNPGDFLSSRMSYPARLGSLAVESIRFNPDYDASRITNGVKADFAASYEIDDPEAANTVRQRSMAWLDWLSRSTSLNVHDFTYTTLAITAAEHGDAETVRQIVEDPKRLWFDKYTISDPTFGQLDRLSTDSIGSKISEIARLMVVAPEGSAEQVRAVVMPTFRNVVTEFVSRDLIAKSYSISRTGDYLITAGTPEAQEQLDVLVAAMPKTPARLDLLAELAERDKRFATAAAEAMAWHQEKTGLAEQTLAGYLIPYGTARNTINFPEDRFYGRDDADASRPIAAAIVDQIPTEADGTSAIETSVAYLDDSMFGGSIHGDALRCVRTLTGNPHFEFTDPRFGFAARFENGENSYAHGRVTVVDASLPEGRVVIDLSKEPFRQTTYDEMHFLCEIIQAEKNRRASVVPIA